VTIQPQPQPGSLEPSNVGIIPQSLFPELPDPPQRGLTPRCEWTRSSFHVPTSRGDCVEVRQYGDGVVGVRDARDEQGGTAAKLFDPGTWRNFVAGVKAGEFDLEEQ
jgi:hypothetical protein